MKKDFLIFDSDGQEMFDALSDNFVASVEKVGNFHAVVVTTAAFKFCAGVYDSTEKARHEVNQLLKEISKAKRGKTKYDGYELSASSVSATELLDSLFDYQAEENSILDNDTGNLLDDLTDKLLKLRLRDLQQRKNL